METDSPHLLWGYRAWSGPENCMMIWRMLDRGRWWFYLVWHLVGWLRDDKADKWTVSWSLFTWMVTLSLRVGYRCRYRQPLVILFCSQSWILVKSRFQASTIVSLCPWQWVVILEVPITWNRGPFAIHLPMVCFCFCFCFSFSFSFSFYRAMYYTIYAQEKQAV